MHRGWSAHRIGTERAELVLAEWFGNARPRQYPLPRGEPATWLVIGGRGSGKTRLGAEWVNGLVRGFSPFTSGRRQYGLIALVGETLGDVREVMIDGPSGIPRPTPTGPGATMAGWRARVSCATPWRTARCG